MTSSFDRAIAAVTTWCVDRAAVTILLFLALAGVSTVFTATYLKIDTDPTLMISNDLPFSKKYHEFSEHFPALRNSFLIIVDSDDPERGRISAGKIADQLKQRPNLFSHVFAPGSGPYFDRYGVLYLSEPAVKKLAADVKQMAPLIDTISLQPDVAGLDDLFKQIVPVVETGNSPAQLTGFLDQLTSTVEAEIAGQPTPLDWTKIGGEQPTLSETRWYVFAKPILDYSAVQAAAGPMDEIRRLIDQFNNSGSDITVQLTGKAALDAEEFENVTKGAVVAAVLSFTLVTLTVLIGLPSIVLLVPALALIFLGFLINAGFATLSVGYLNMISVAFAVLYIGLGIDYAVHVVLRFAEQRAKGSSGRDAAIAAVGKIAAPLALCTLTTSLAFLSFVPTAFDGMAQLGIIGSGGSVIAFICSITLVPAILSILPGPQDKIARRFAGYTSVNGEEGQANGSRLRKFATPVLILLALVSGALLPQARFDGDPINLKDPAAPSMIAFNDVVERQPGRVYAIQALSKPGKAVDEMVAKLEALPEVTRVESIRTVMPADQQAKLAHLNALADVLPPDILPADPLDNAERLEYLNSILASIERMARADAASEEIRGAAAKLQDSLTRFISAKGQSAPAVQSLQTSLLRGFPELFSKTRQLADLDAVTLANVDPGFKERYVTADGRWRLQIVPRDDMRDAGKRSRFVDAVTTVNPDATGTLVDVDGSADVVASAMRLACLTALGLVIIVLSVTLRRFKDVMLVLAPLVLAGVLVVGYTVVFDAPFNFANVIVLPLLLGLGVDTAIHYVMRARQETVATDVVATSTPRAVLISAITTMGSFGTLWLSPHRGMASMGELLTIAIIVTLMCTLIVLPQLIDWSTPKKSQSATK